VALAQRSALRIVETGLHNLDLERLVPSIAAGDEPAAARFYDATSGLLFGLLLLILGDTATAEEVLLGVYAEVRQNAVRFDRNHESLLTWLITIAHRRALEHLCSSSEDQQFIVSVGFAGPPGSGQVRRFGISKSAHRRLVGSYARCSFARGAEDDRAGLFFPDDPTCNRGETATIARCGKSRPAIRNLGALQLVQEPRVSQRSLRRRGRLAETQ
jgi:hypothetical protein